MVSTEANVAYGGTYADLGMPTQPYLSSVSDLNFADFLFGDSSFTSVNTSASAPSTISPRDLLMDSVPPSSVIPDLTPASAMLETPWTSPMEDFNNDVNHYPSLFAHETIDDDFPSFAPSMTRQDSSASQIVVHPGGDRKRSAVDESPEVESADAATARKKRKPLKPITVDPSDVIAVKRAKNTAAARKSRDKKENHVATLEARIAEQAAQIAAMQQEIAQLKAQAQASAKADDFGFDFTL